MNTQVIERIVQKYGITSYELMPVQKGYRNESYGIVTSNGLKYNLIIYKQEPGIRTKISLANRTSDFLVEHGLPCRLTQSSRIIELSGSERLQYGSLYNYLPGLTIPWEAYTKNHIKLLGMAMGQMHGLLANLSPDGFENIIDQLQLSLSRMKDYFNDMGVQGAIRRKTSTDIALDTFEYFATTLKMAAKLPNQQVLHMDFVRGNVLFETTKNNTVSPLRVGNLAISGMLDFEKVAYGSTVFDLARTLAFLLVDCKYKPANRIYKYFLQSGYVRRGQMEPPILSRLEPLVNLFLMYDFYKFLLHNPYESLARNEHFVRTRSILIQRKMVVAV